MRSDWTLIIRDGDGAIILAGRIEDLLATGALKTLTFSKSLCSRETPAEQVLRHIEELAAWVADAPIESGEEEG